LEPNHKILKIYASVTKINRFLLKIFLDYYKGYEMYCGNCSNQIDDNATVCVKCGVPPHKLKKFCNNCGTSSNENQIICLNCGCSLKKKNSTEINNAIENWANAEKSKSTATLLALFIGTLGANKFYMGSWGWGIVYLVLCLSFFFAWVPLIINFIELVKLILMTDNEFNQKAEDFKGQGPFGFFW